MEVHFGDEDHTKKEGRSEKVTVPFSPPSRLAVAIHRSQDSVQVVKKYHPVVRLLDLIGKTFGP